MAKRITEKAVVQELGHIAFGEAEGFKAPERMKALELLGKYLGMWSDKAQLSAADGELSRLGQLIALLGMKDEQPDAGAVPKI